VLAAYVAEVRPQLLSPAASAYVFLRLPADYGYPGRRPWADRAAAAPLSRQQCASAPS
jgi:hypothetical protein